MRRLLTLAMTIPLVLAGCIALPEDTQTAVPERESRTGGSMTAEESSKQDTAVCTQNILGGGDGRFCATRTITVDGALSGFATLDVELQTFNGDITLTESKGDAWGFVVTLQGKGSTAAEAESRLNDIIFEWAHEDTVGHFVEIVAKSPRGQSEGRSAEIALSMPRSVALVATIATSNGDVTIDGTRSAGLSIATSNGDIEATTEVTHVNFATSNGEVDAILTPIADGRWNIATSNGDITVTVPENARVGYEMEGTTSNGEVDYTLRDGTEGPCPEGSQYYTPPCNHRTFATSGFADRDTQVRVGMATSNGEINVGPT